MSSGLSQSAAELADSLVWQQFTTAAHWPHHRQKRIMADITQEQGPTTNSNFGQTQLDRWLSTLRWLIPWKTRQIVSCNSSNTLFSRTFLNWKHKLRTQIFYTQLDQWLSTTNSNFGQAQLDDYQRCAVNPRKNSSNRWIHKLFLLESSQHMYFFTRNLSVSLNWIDDYQYSRC